MRGRDPVILLGALGLGFRVSLEICRRARCSFSSKGKSVCSCTMMLVEPEIPSHHMALSQNIRPGKIRQAQVCGTPNPKHKP